MLLGFVNFKVLVLIYLFIMEKKNVFLKCILFLTILLLKCCKQGKDIRYTGNPMHFIDVMIFHT